MSASESKDLPEISVVINTLNEEQNLHWCLRSVVAWATEIIVVDMHSVDATRDIAARYGARVFLHEPLGFADPARAFAIAQTHSDWVLILDADELVPKGLSQDLRQAALEGAVDVVQIPRRNYMFGAPIDHSGWEAFGDRQARFFRRESLTTTGEIHRFLKPAPWARLRALPNVDGHTLVHFNYVTFDHFIEKLNRYTSIEATRAFERNEEVSPIASLGKAIEEWFRRFVSKRGYRDGWRGFYLALSMAFYQLAMSAKLRELREAGTADEIKAEYAKLAASVIADYGKDADSR